MHNRRGFTLIELLVVVAIIGVLIAILVPHLGRVKESARRTTCATQLKGQGMSYAIYASNFNGALPAGPEMDAPGGSTWLHDESIKLCDSLIGIQTTAGMDPNSVRRWFFCPSNPVYNQQQFWDTGIANKRSVGYTSIRDRAIGAPMGASVLPTPRSPQLVYRKKWNPAFSAGNSELVEDIIITDVQPNGAAKYGTAVASTGAFINSVSHLKGSIPAGSNILYLDGHASWSNWGGPSKVHWVLCGGGPSGTVYFTLIDP